jgi:glucokinase
MILSGDVGGTHSRLALFDDNLKLLRQEVFQNAGESGLDVVARQFLDRAPLEQKIGSACFGVAGPVRDGHVKLTNLKWEFDEQSLAKHLDIPRVALINDLSAHAQAVELLTPDQLIELNAPAGPRKPGNRAIIAAGTGLGEAGLVWDSAANCHHPVACEGGHCDFSPRDNREFALLEHLKKTGKPLSWEAVLSGPGLRNIYDFVIGFKQIHAVEPLVDADPKPAEISKAAVEKSNPACIAAMELFITCYGAEAGNLALKFLASDGIYLGGGIAPKIAPLLKASSQFLQRFTNKGPSNIQDVLKAIPIYIINSESAALYGAANHARRMPT